MLLCPGLGDLKTKPEQRMRCRSGVLRNNAHLLIPGSMLDHVGSRCKSLRRGPPDRTDSHTAGRGFFRKDATPCTLAHSGQRRVRLLCVHVRFTVSRFRRRFLSSKKNPCLCSATGFTSKISHSKLYYSSITSNFLSYAWSIKYR